MTSATTAIPTTQITAAQTQAAAAPSLTFTELVKVTGEFFNTGLGAHRLYQCASTAYKWTVQLNPMLVGPELDAVNDRIRTADNVGILPKLFNTTKNIVSNWEAYQFERARPDPSQTTLSTRCKKVAMDAVEWIGDFSRTLLIGMPTHFGCQVVGTGSDLILDIRDFGEGVSGIRRSQEDLDRLQVSTADERRRPTEEGRSYWLKTAKSVFSFIGNGVNLAGHAVGGVLLSPLASLVIASATLFFAMSKQFYADTMTHVLAQRMREREVQLLASA